MDSRAQGSGRTVRGTPGGAEADVDRSRGWSPGVTVHRGSQKRSPDDARNTVLRALGLSRVALGLVGGTLAIVYGAHGALTGESDWWIALVAGTVVLLAALVLLRLRS